MNAIKVHELNKYIKKYISMDYILTDMKVEGEISNFKHHSNGNMYMSLKDDNSKIDAIIYSMDTDKIDFTPQDGDSVIVRGTVSVYEKDASIRLFIREMNLKGLGDLHEKFLRLKESLYKEGLFDEESKKKIPYFPDTVGVITSPTGAAIRDIINVLKRRNSSVNLILYPSNVQGDKAPEMLIEGLKYFNENPVDVIILGRGGGGYEDLFCFNDEALAREIHKSHIPVISAVGHEIDFVISDFVSDLRAPTPSAASEIVAMSKEDLKNKLDMSLNIMNQRMENNIKEHRDEINNNKNKLDEFINLKIIDEKKFLVHLKHFLDYKKPSIKAHYLKLEDKRYLLSRSFVNIIKRENTDLENAYKDLNKAFKKKIDVEDVLLKYTLKSLVNKRPDKYKIGKEKDKIDRLYYLLNKDIEFLINKKKTELSELKDSMKNPSNMNILVSNNDKIVLKASEIKTGDKLKISFTDGEVNTLVNEVFFRSDLNE